VVHALDEAPGLDKNRAHRIEIVIDRVLVAPDNRKRIADSVETALETSGGSLIALRIDEGGEREEFFSRRSACPDCGISLPELQPRLFSFNNPQGACPA